MSLFRNVREKNDHIETLRGIAILLVIAGHVIGSDSGGGMKVSDNSVWRYLYCLFENIRMPLFTVISGWVYSMRPLGSDSSYRTFITKKIRRLLFPMIFVGGSYFIIQCIIPNTNTDSDLGDLWRIFIFPNSVYWYLPALFLIFSLFALADSHGMMSDIRKCISVFIFSLVLCYAQVLNIIPDNVPNVFAFKGACYLAPFFVMGIALQRFRTLLCGKQALRIYAAGFITGIILQQIYFFNPESFPLYSRLYLKVPIGIISVCMLMSLSFSTSKLNKIASYSYSLYLFHAFGTAGGRIILNRFGITESTVVFAVSFLFAILLSIFLEETMKRNRITAALFLGRSFKRKIFIPEISTHEMR